MSPYPQETDFFFSLKFFVSVSQRTPGEKVHFSSPGGLGGSWSLGFLPLLMTFEPLGRCRSFLSQVCPPCLPRSSVKPGMMAGLPSDGERRWGSDVSQVKARDKSVIIPSVRPLKKKKSPVSYVRTSSRLPPPRGGSCLHCSSSFLFDN